MPRLLIATTVGSTVQGFLLPFAHHDREKGWQVDALASGISQYEERVSVFARGHVLYGLGGTAFSGMKFMLDLIAVATGLKYKLLSRRARPLPAELRREWLKVWELTTAGRTHHGN